MEPLVSIKEAASTWGVSREFVKRLYRRGELQVVRFGRVVRIPQHELERIARQGVPRRQK